MLAYESQFAFVPFLKPRAGLEDMFTGGRGAIDESLEDEFEEAGLLNGSMLGTPFVCSLAELNASGFVRDFAMMHGYFTPTVAILTVCHERLRLHEANVSVH